MRIYETAEEFISEFKTVSGTIRLDEARMSGGGSIHTRLSIGIKSPSCINTILEAQAQVPSGFDERGLERRGSLVYISVNGIRGKERKQKQHSEYVKIVSFKRRDGLKLTPSALEALNIVTGEKS
jgi:hypothetical protein